MTAQAGETIIYKGKKTWMATEPLREYLKTREDILFNSYSTACWRGYFGTWEIKQNKLYLIDLKANSEMHGEVGLDYLFPKQKRNKILDYLFSKRNKIFASWFTGEIRIPTGEMLEYVHAGYASIYEKDLMLTFKEGILMNEMEIDNRKTFKKMDGRLFRDED